MTQTGTNPTPGPWVYVSSDGSIINPNGINDNKDSWHIAELTSKDGCLAANGYLIAEAGTVYHETGLSPRQLLEQRNELLDLLIWFVDSKRANFLVHGSDPKFHIARETISRIVNSSIAAARTHCEERSSSGEAKTSKEGV